MATRPVKQGRARWKMHWRRAVAESFEELKLVKPGPLSTARAPDGRAAHDRSLPGPRFSVAGMMASRLRLTPSVP
jgi:hypothetical protein